MYRESIYMCTYVSSYTYRYKICTGMKSATESSLEEKHLRALVDEELKKIC